MKNETKPQIECLGTRYHNVVIMNSDYSIGFIGCVSTPLNAEELRRFVRHRIGIINNTASVYISQLCTNEYDKQALRIKVIGLAKFEEELKAFIPEYNIEEMKVVITNKGNVNIESIDGREE